MNSSNLLKAYLSIWNNRKPNYNEQNANEILKEFIKRDLNDENSHPRIRKSRDRKFYISIKRIYEADLVDSDKLALINLYIEEMNKFKK